MQLKPASTATSELVIFTVADRRYEPFILPYIASCLTFNPTAFVEIGVEDAEAFRLSNQEAIDLLTNQFGDAFLIRNVTFIKGAPGSARFMNETNVRRRYLYIGDIDIFVLEEIAPKHIDKMAETGLPYSNTIRQGKRRLTGLHFTETNALYPLDAFDGDVTHHDEVLLYERVLKKGLPLPNKDETFRPLHGFHLSLNRRPTCAIGYSWSLNNWFFLDAFLKLTETDLWRTLFPMLDARYKTVFAVLDFILETKYPWEYEKLDRRWLLPKSLFDD
ncbi:MAG: hypothetical protein AAGA22_06570 [Pseudomonadota bacterium]